MAQLSTLVLLASAIFCSDAIQNDDVINGFQIWHHSGFCNGKTGRSNKFTARISKVKPGKTYQGTFLMVPGGHAQTWVGEQTSSDYDGQKELMSKLYDDGYRILEIKWEKSLTEHSQYEDTHHCPMYALNKALFNLKDEYIGTSSEKWWPADYNDRYAMGTSSGQVSLSIAIDKLQYDFAKMKYVIYGGGGNSYDNFMIINCRDSGYTIPLSKIEHLYPGADTKCYNDPTCQGDSTMANALNDNSLKTHTGTGSDDTSRADKVLFNTGPDHGCNKAINTAYYNGRLGTKKLWDFTDWCTAPPHNVPPMTNSEGHKPINTVYTEKGNVDEWLNFIKSGTLAATVACPAS